MSDKQSNINNLIPEWIKDFYYSNIKSATEEEKKNLVKLLKDRRERNRKLGLHVSEKEPEIDYANDLPEEVLGEAPSKDAIKINTAKRHRDPRITIAHEMEHTADPTSSRHELLTSYGKFNMHDRDKSGDIKTGMDNEDLRARRSILFEHEYNDAVLEKYAKEQGIPLEDLIDKMVINSQVARYNKVKEAHNKTKENMDKGVKGKAAYEPWEKLKKKVPEKKKKKE
jgi:hypothetical protein